MKHQFKRAHLRAPVYRDALYESEGHVLKAKVLNISEGGILLGELACVPEINALPLMVSLPVYPEFNSLNIYKDHFELPEINSRVIRLKAKIVRNFTKRTATDHIFENIGCQIIRPTDEVKLFLKEYVQKYGRNLVFLLSLFQTMGNSKKNIGAIRQLAKLLGHDSSLPVAHLRMKLIHDYQSLEGL